MNKQEYLEKLEACLKHKLSREEIEDIMRDYAEYFEEGRRQSKQDVEIAAKLGDPELVAQQLIEESAEQGAEHYIPPRSGEKKNPWEAAKETFKDLENRFLEWDRGKAEKSDAEAAPPEQPEEAPQPKPEKEPKQKTKKPNNALQKLWKRFSRSMGHLCQWWFCALSSVVLMVALSCLSAVWIGLSAFVLAVLLVGLAGAVALALGLLAMIILSGVVGWGLGTWAGASMLFGSIAGIGLDVLAAMLVWFLLKRWKLWTARAYRKTKGLWKRLLHKVESWLVTPREPAAPETQPEQTASQPELMALPQTTPVSTEPAEREEEQR